LREQNVYNNGRKAADFLLNDSSPVADKVVIELKCQSLGNYQNFASGLTSDIQKLLGELKPVYEGASLLVVGIYFADHDDIPRYFSKKVLGIGEVGICWAVDLGN
jgi:hypothetical protein